MRQATLSTIIERPVKDAVTRFCRARGLKLRHFIEEALIEQLEDEIDREAYESRRHEERVSLKTILSEVRRERRR